MDDHTAYWALPDKFHGLGNGPSAAIPTLGAAASAIDQYRMVAVASTNLPEVGGAFTDVNAVAAIARLAEGGLTNVAELEAAETALQAILLHDAVHVLIASAKVDSGNGFSFYKRYDANERTTFGYDLFSLASSRDWLVAAESIKVADGVVVDSTLPDSSFIGLQMDQLAGVEYWRTPVASEAINVAIESHGIPAYLSEPALLRSRRGDGFSKRFYHRIRKSWDDAVGDIPPIVCTFSLPPLLAVVLDRLNNRADLRSAVAGLRAELAQVRNELREFNSIVTQSTSNAEIEARIRHITESFDAIVPESRLSPAQRRRRRILSIQGLARPLIKFAMGFATHTGASLEDGLKLGGGIGDLVESKALVDRTITAQTFAGLLNTESLQALVKHHFSQAEIDSIERSIHNSVVAKSK
jgi:hypothetical protein